MGENSLANAGEMGSVPDVGRFHMPWSYKAHASQPLGLCSRACMPQLLEPTHLKPVLPNKRSHLNEKP